MLLIFNLQLLIYLGGGKPILLLNLLCHMKNAYQKNNMQIFEFISLQYESLKHYRLTTLT